jgi:hypothetical protein
MKKRYSITGFKFGHLLLLALSLFVSCKHNQEHLSIKESSQVKDSVSRMTANIARDISNKGPAAWLNYFEDTPDFFMANDGQLVFKDYPSAKAFILNTVVKIIPGIKLRWDHIRIEPLTPELASIGADFHEDQINNVGKTLSYDGYLTGVAHYSGRAWKLRSLHWSIKAPIDTPAK